MPDETQTTPSPKRKRRWLQLSLRTFLVFVVAFGVWLGWYVERAERQRRAVQAIVEAGGHVYYDWEMDGLQLIERKTIFPKFLVDFFGTDYFTHPIRACLNEQKALNAIAPLREISELTIRSESNLDLSRLRHVNLKRLSLRVEDENISLETLGIQRNLEVLHFSGSPVLELNFERLPNLRCLLFDRPPVFDLKTMSSQKGLKVIYLGFMNGRQEEVLALRESLPDCVVDYSSFAGKTPTLLKAQNKNDLDNSKPETTR